MRTSNRNIQGRKRVITCDPGIKRPGWPWESEKEKKGERKVYHSPAPETAGTLVKRMCGCAQKRIWVISCVGSGEMNRVESGH